MRISDWSSDVCSSDLADGDALEALDAGGAHGFRENGAAGLLAFAHDWEYTNGRSQRQVVIFSHSRKCDRAHRAETAGKAPGPAYIRRSEEHTSELQSLMRISYAVFCLKKKKNTRTINTETHKNKYKNQNCKKN